MSGPAEFLSLANQCFQIADAVGTLEQRSSLLTMAQVWLDLAAEAKQLTELVQEADTAFEVRAPEIARTAPPWAADLAQKSA